MIVCIRIIPKHRRRRKGFVDSLDSVKVSQWPIRGTRRSCNSLFQLFVSENNEYNIKAAFGFSML